MKTLSIFASPILVLSALLAAGCGSHGVAPAVLPAGATVFPGEVHGGQQPISDALIQIYAVGSTGDGSASTALITTTVTTSDGTDNPSDSNANGGNALNTLPAGSFIIPAGSYTCPVDNPDVYIVASGGNPGLSIGTNNPQSVLLAAMGSCDGLSALTQVVINEITTVGSIAPLSAYMTSYSALGSGAGDASQLTAALAEVNEYTNTVAGSTPGTSVPAGYSVPSTAIQTLADILAGCVNSSGGVAGDATVCGELFTLATPPSGTAPTDTVGAIINIENNPTQNVSQIYDLLGSFLPFQPTLTTAPTTWALPITSSTATQLAFQTGPSNTADNTAISPAVTVAIEDASGNVQTSDTDAVTLALGANPSGGKLSGTITVNAINGIATFPGVSIDKVGNGYTLTASATGLTGATSGTFNVTAGTATKLAFTVQPSSTGSGNSITPAVAVSVEDASGNVVTTSTAQVALAIGVNPGTSTLSGTTTVAAVNGVATFSNLSLNNLGSSYTLTASSSGLTGATSNSFNITGAAINVGAAIVGNNSYNSVSLSLPVVAPATELMTITSNDTTHFLLSTSATAVGTAYVQVPVTKGSASLPSIYIQGQGYTGTTTITGTLTATADGYANGTGTESLYPSGVGFVTASFTTTTQASPTTLQVDLFSLNPGTLSVYTSESLGPQAAPLTITVTSGTTATGTMTGSPGSIAQGAYYNNTTKFVPAAGGTSTLTVTPSAGYSVSTSASYPGSITATVEDPTITMGDQIVGNNSYVNFSVNLQSTPATADTFTITSNDPTHFLISTSATVAGSASVTVNVNAGNNVPTLFLQGQNYSGTTAITSTLTITDSSGLYSTGTGNAILYPSGLGFITRSFSTTTLATKTILQVDMFSLVPGTLAVYTSEALGPQAAPLAFTLTSGTPATGTITGSPASIAVGLYFNTTTYFVPAGVGTSTLTLSEPAGYFASTTSTYPVSITATVTGPTITISDQIVGNELITSFNVSLQTPPNASDTFTITSNDPSHFLLSATSTAVGTASVQFTVNSGGSIPALYLEGQNYTGTTAITSTLTVTDSLGLYSTGTGNLILYPSGFGFYTSSFSTTTFASSTQITVGLLALNPGTLSQSAQGYLGPQASAVTYTISSDTPATGTITGSPATFPQSYGTTYGQTVHFQPVGAGTAIVSLTEPAGFSTPNAFGWPMSFTATVTAPTLNVSATTVGNNLITQVNVSAQTAPSADETVTLTVGDSTHFLLSSSTTAVGSASITVTLPKNGSMPAIYVEGQNFNENPTAWSTTLTVSAPGYTTGTGTLKLYPSGVVFYNINTVNTTPSSSPTSLTPAIVVLNPGTLTEALTGMNLGPQATAISFAITSGTPATGTITGSPATIPVGAWSLGTIKFNPLADGTSVLTITQPPGFDAGTSTTFASTITATVTGS